MLGLLTSWNLPNSQFPELQIYKLEKENVCPNHRDKVVISVKWNTVCANAF